MEFTDPRKTPFVPVRSRGELPHLYKPGGIYFVTFRLADAVLPVRQRRAVVTPPDVGPAALMVDYDPPLSLGSCALAGPAVAELVQNAIRFFEGSRYHLAAWCVMPNHVHAVLAPAAGHPLADILHSWKSFTSHQANRILKRTGTFWERESFDHLIRSAQQVGRFVGYVEDNPVAAGLCGRPDEWLYSSAGSFQSEVWRR